MDTLVFQLGGQRFGVAAYDVVELLPAVSVTPLPRAPAIVEGVINVRGQLVPVLDIRSRFGLEERPVRHSDHYVVAKAGKRVVAVRADRALDLVHVPGEALIDATEAVPASPYIKGVAKLPDGLVLLHDLHAFLTSAEEASLDAAFESAALEGADG